MSSPKMRARLKNRSRARAQENRPKEDPVIYQFPPLHIFGFSGIRGRLSQLACLDRDSVVYAIGCGLYCYRHPSSVPLVRPEKPLEKILALVGSSTGHHVASCESLKLGPGQVSVYDVRGPRKVQTFVTRGGGDIEACAFSKDEKQIVGACNGGNGSVLYCWDVDLPKEICTMVFPHVITRVSVNPKDNEEFVTSGPTHFKFWSRKEDANNDITVEGLHGQDGSKVTFTDHIWLIDNSIAVATADGIIFVVSESMVKQRLLDTGNTLCLAATPRGFYTGRQDGLITEFTGFDLVSRNKMDSSKDAYSDVVSTSVARDLAPISTIVVAPDADQVIFIVELKERIPAVLDANEGAIRKDVYGENVVRLDLGKHVASDLTLRSRMSVFTVGALTDMDVCLHRMLIVTCGKDNVVRLWSYAQLICEMSHTFDEEPLSVAISCYLMLVGFMHCVKVYRLLADKIVLIDEISLKGVSQMRWSPSGHLVAMATGRDVVLFSSSTWKIITMLKGHMGVVTSLAWSADSIYLSSAGIDGAVYSWFMDGFHRYSECVIKGFQYSCILYHPNRRYIYACGTNIPVLAIDTDKKLESQHVVHEERSDEKTLVEMGYASSDEEEPTGSSWEHHVFRGSVTSEMKPKGVTQIAGMFGRKLLIATNEAGEMFVYALPLATNEMIPLWKKPINAGRITGLFVDERHNLVLMASAQGSIIMSTIKTIPFTDDPDPPSPQGLLRVDENDPVNILLMRWPEVKEVKRASQEFTLQLKKEHEEMLYKAHIKDQDRALAMKEKDELQMKLQNELGLKIRLLEQRIRMAESNKETTIQSLLDSQESNLKEMNEQYEMKILKEAKRAHIVRRQAEKERDSIGSLMMERHRAFILKMERLEMRLEGAQAAADMKVRRVEEVCNKEVENYAMETMINDEELERSLKRLTEELLAERQRADRAFGQVSYEKNCYMNYQAKIGKMEEEEKQIDAKMKEMLQENLKLKKLLLEVDYQRASAKQLLLETDKKSESLLQKNKEQENMRLVYDFKIQQLLRKKDPMEAGIRQSRRELHEMERHQAGNIRDMKEADEVEKNLKERLVVQEVQLKHLHDKLLEREIYINTFTQKLCCIIKENDETEWSKLIKDLYMHYVTDVHRAMTSEGLEAQVQILRQKKTLEKFVKVLEDAVIRKEGEHQQESQQFVQENLHLLHEFADSNRNVQRLGLIVKELQGEEAYSKAVAAKHRYVTSNVLSRMSQTRLSRSSPPPNQRRSKSVASGRMSRLSARSASPSVNIGCDTSQKPRRKLHLPPLYLKPQNKTCSGVLWQDPGPCATHRHGSHRVGCHWIPPMFLLP